MTAVAAPREQPAAVRAPVTAPARRPRWRRALLVCVLVGVVHALVWTVINPPMQGPDEFTHVAQVDAMAKLLGADDYDRTPRPNELDVFIHGVPFTAEGPPSWSSGEATRAAEAIADARWAGYGPSYGVLNPPLYYLVAAVPDRVFSGLSLVDRLWIMRLTNLLLFAATIAFCFLFVREVLPRHPWAWTLGGLVVALQPLAAFMAGSVSVDNLLFTASAGLFLAVGRAFHRGLNVRRGIAIGVALLVGLLTKGTTFGFIPAVALAVAVLAFRAWRSGARLRVLGAPAAAIAFALPFWVWLQVNTHLLGRSGGTTTGGYSAPTDRLTYAKHIASYTWQVFLPPIGPMRDQYQDFFATNPPFPAFPQQPLWETWLQGFVGRFGWHQFEFPDWVNVPAAIVFVALGALATRALWRATGRLRRRRAELLTYALMAAGVFMLVTVAGYGWRVSHGGLSFEQARYLLPLLPLYPAVVAAAVVGLRRRAGLALSAVLLVLAVGHALGAFVLTLGRYYT